MLGLNPRAATRNLRVERDTRSKQVSTPAGDSIPVYEQEFWTSRQRQASPIHEISYRGCFKPQLPAYFVERLTKANARWAFCTDACASASLSLLYTVS